MSATMIAANRPIDPKLQSRKQRAAGLSIASNTTLIALKVVAGVVTGSVAIITEAMHSSIDLLSSLLAYISVRKAGKPADELHRYGHEKIEYFTAAIEGMLVLVGSGVIIYESIHRLITGHKIASLDFGITVIAISAVANILVSAYILRSARATNSPALKGDGVHIRTDAYTSIGVLVGLIAVQITGASWIDPVIALIVACAIIISGGRILTSSARILVDESLPKGELDTIRAVVMSFGPRGVVGFHDVRTRGSGTRRYIDMHVQFRSGTTLKDAHATAHALQDAIGQRLENADILIHLEPQENVRPGAEVPEHRLSED